MKNDKKYFQDARKLFYEAKQLRKQVIKEWRKLAEAGIRLATERGLEIVLTETPVDLSFGKVIIYKKGDEILEDEPLMTIAKEANPDLYLRYEVHNTRFENLKKELSKYSELLKNNQAGL